jgi:CHAD domain-containing protein
VVFEFEHPAWPIEDSARAAAREELDRAIGEVAETGFEIHETVRHVRRRLKRVRAVIGLIQPAFPDHRAESRLLRELGGEISALRDASALVDAVDVLLRGADGDVAGALHAARRRFAAAAAGADTGLDRDSFLGALRGKLRDARVRAEMWELAADGGAAVVPGFVGTYAKARRGYRMMQKAPTDEHLHEWRKAVKFHWAQLGLLRRFAPEFAERRRDAAKRLAETLGNHHNLCVLRSALSAEEIAQMGTALEVKLARLQRRAARLGRQLFADRPKEVRKRWVSTFADRDAVLALGR